MPNYGTVPGAQWRSTHLKTSLSSDDCSLPPTVINTTSSNEISNKRKFSNGTVRSFSSMFSRTPSANLFASGPPLTPLSTPHAGVNSNDSEVVQTDPPKNAVENQVDLRPQTPPSRRRRLLGGIPSPTMRLENSGSVARDHLASERTFLAYMRTSLALASTGVALVQLFTVSSGGKTVSPATHRVQEYAPILGATLISLGIAVLIIGVMRFFAIQFALVKGQFPVARLYIGFIASSLAVLITVVFAILLAGRR